MSVVAAAVIGSAAVGVYSANKQAKAASKAGDQQAAAAMMGVEEQQRQFDAIQKLLKPYVDAGAGALSKQQSLIGLNGAAAQRNALNLLEQSPQFTTAMKAGEEAILANASATGGLRGGNTQAALAQFRPQLLAQMINDQYSRLAGVSSMGLGAAGGTGQFAQSATNNVTNLLQQQGAALAGSSLAQGRAAAGYSNAITGAIGLYGGLGGFERKQPAAESGVISGGSGFRVM